MSVVSSNKKIRALLRIGHGYAEYGQLVLAGMHPRDINVATQNNVLIKIKKGLYRVSDTPAASHQGFADAARAISGAVICLVSALDYHGLTTFNPSLVSVALPRSASMPKIAYPPTELYRFSKTQYEAGITQIKIAGIMVNIYSPEKTICDCFRYRNKLGLDLAKEGLAEYLKKKNKNLDTLLTLAQLCRIKPLMETWLRAMT